MENIDFGKVAKERTDEIVELCNNNSRKKYVKTFYVAVDDTNHIKLGMTPDTLIGAHRCLLIHEWKEKAVSIWYDTYKVHYIDESGVCSDGIIDKDYRIGIEPSRFNVPSKMFLYRKKTCVFSSDADLSGRSHYSFGWEPILSDVWNLYLKCKQECHTEKEALMLRDIVNMTNSNRILKERLSEAEYEKMVAQKERDVYKQMLDEIKELVCHK